MSIIITASHGFFSCCSCRLHEIIKYLNKNGCLPISVDSTKQFGLYKIKGDPSDITFNYFKHYDNINLEYNFPVDYTQKYQYNDYSLLEYKKICPIVEKYFSPSTNVNEIVNNLEKKYNIIYDNTLAVYYRGTDKIKETSLSSFDDFYKQIIKITDINKNINILIQTDTAKFIDYINGKNLKNIFIITENKTSYTNKGVHKESRDTNYYDMFNFLSTVLIISKCKYIICSSGNCSIWMMLYRGNGKNVIQYLKGTWYNTVF